MLLMRSMLVSFLAATTEKKGNFPWYLIAIAVVIVIVLILIFRSSSKSSSDSDDDDFDDIDG